MPCYIGMSTDVGSRLTAHRRAYPAIRNSRIIASGLTYDEALARERSAAQRMGCHQSGGGLRVDGRVWSVYAFDF